MNSNHQNKRTVYAVGETVVDLVSDGGFTLQFVPGGSVLNASVSLGRVGVDIQLVSEFGDDKAGDLIQGFLKSNSVKTDFSIRNVQHKTSLALAFLDKKKNASYSFYHDTPEKLTVATIPCFTGNDILLFGSFYAVKANRREFIKRILQKASEAKTIIYYDLNIRKPHTSDLDILFPTYLNNISVANIVKGSDEDFQNILGISDPEKVYEKISPYCKILIVTAGSKPLHVFTPGFRKTYNIPPITPVSTIGAGDNFNAGFIYGLSSAQFQANRLENLLPGDMDRFIGCGLAFASETCLSAENYIKGNFGPDFWIKYI
jgi:fructokinase